MVKKTNHIFTTKEKIILEKIYLKNKNTNISKQNKKFLANKLNVPEKQIDSWFKDRNKSSRYHASLEKLEQRLKREMDGQKMSESGSESEIEEKKTKTKYVKRSARKTYTIEQKILLEESFSKNPIPSKEEIQRLAEKCKTSSQQIERWFYTRDNDKKNGKSRYSLEQLRKMLEIQNVPKNSVVETQIISESENEKTIDESNNEEHTNNQTLLEQETKLPSDNNFISEMVKEIKNNLKKKIMGEISSYFRQEISSNFKQEIMREITEETINLFKSK